MSEPDPDTLGVSVAKRRLEGFSDGERSRLVRPRHEPERAVVLGRASVTRLRHWVAGRGWIEDDKARHSSAPAPGLEPSGVFRAQQQRSISVAGPRIIRSFTIGVLLLMACGIALMYGSVEPGSTKRPRSAPCSLHAIVIGTDPAITTLIGCNGWVTFIAGVVLLVFGGLSVSPTTPSWPGSPC